MSVQGRVLVVDDEPGVRGLCEMALKSMGLAVRSASSPAEARACLRDAEFDVVLTDLAMPAPGDGESLAREIKLRFPATDVVIMTAYPSLETAVPTLKSGACEYLVKPFGAEFLRSAVASCLERRRLRGELDIEKTLRAELEASYAELRKVERLKDAILSRLSHELRAPLFSCRLSLERIESGDGVEARRGLRASLERLREVVDELLSFAERPEEVPPAARKEVDLPGLLKTLAREYRAIFLERRVTILLEADRAGAVRADPERLRLAFKHLLLNAAYYNEPGGRVRVEGWRDGKVAFLRVSDTGPGIPEEELPRLFDGFYQAAEHLTRKVGGLGLGLAIVRRIVEAHGGTVGVHSEKGRGSAFTVGLPFA